MQDFLRKIDLSTYSSQAIDYGIKFAVAVLILLIGAWLAARLANFGRRAMVRARFDDTLVGFLRNVIYGVLIVLVIVAALQKAGVPSASLIAAVGAAGLAIGLALQGSLSNLAWGVLLIATRPFKVGDFVEIAGVTGTVSRIGLLQTWLVLADNREACMPNGKVGSDAIINYNRRGKRRAEILLRVPYSADLDKVMQEMLRTCAADPRVLSDPKPAVFAVGLDDGNVELSARAWATTEDYWSVLTDLTHSIKQRLDAAGIRLAPPQREILMRQDAESGQHPPEQAR